MAGLSLEVQAATECPTCWAAEGLYVFVGHVTLCTLTSCSLEWVCVCSHSFGSGGMCAQFFPPIIQRSASPAYISYTSAEHLLTLCYSKAALHQWAGAADPTAPYLSVLQQRGGNKLLKGLGSCKLASSLGQGQLRLSKLTLHPLLPSPVLPVFSSCGNATN